MPYLVARVMGTTVSIDVRDEAVPVAALDGAVATLRELEARFTTYREDSDVKRLERGELELRDAHPDVREVLDACSVLRAESGGAFDAWRDGVLDPSGYVKGWAAERAADVLRRGGSRRFALNLGGDVVCSGEPATGLAWRVGVRHPAEGRGLAVVLGVRNGAVATSGGYERGNHIVDARTGRAAAHWRSITVVAPDLATADAIATAALAMGPEGPTWAAGRPGCEVVAIGQEDRLFVSKGIADIRLH